MKLKLDIETQLTKESFEKVTKDYSHIWYYINQAIQEFDEGYNIKMNSCKIKEQIS